MLTKSKCKILSNQTGCVYEKLIFSDLDDNALTIEDCRDITIKDCIFINIIGDAIHIKNSSNINVIGCRMENIWCAVYAKHSSAITVKDCFCHTINGFIPRGQFVFFYHINGAGSSIQSNTVMNSPDNSIVNDIIKIQASSGADDAPILIQKNIIKGHGSIRGCGGISLGYGGGNNQIAQDNVLINPGQYGISCTGGCNIQIKNNLIYSEKNMFSKMGILIWAMNSDIKDIVISNNKVLFIAFNGGNKGFWNNCAISNLTMNDNDWSADENIFKEYL